MDDGETLLLRSAERHEDGDRRRDLGVVSQAGRQVSSGQESGRRRSRRQVQRSGRGVRSAQRYGEAGRYDRFGHAGVDGPQAAARPTSATSTTSSKRSATSSATCSAAAAAAADAVAAQQGGDVRADVTLDLREAARGCKKEIQISRHARCDDCGGSGASKGSKPETCRYCGGRGQVIQSTGIFRVQTTCPACHGAGTTINDPCASCRGEGYVLERVTREVQIPAGVDNGTRLRITGEGDPSPNGGPPGDCYCFITVKEHSLFQRDGQHLICSMPISYSQAALGATIEVPTLDGRDELKIPAGTQPGEVFRLKGARHARPARARQAAILLVQVQVEVPAKLTKRQEQLLARTGRRRKGQRQPAAQELLR